MSDSELKSSPEATMVVPNARESSEVMHNGMIYRYKGNPKELAHLVRNTSLDARSTVVKSVHRVSNKSASTRTRPAKSVQMVSPNASTDSSGQKTPRKRVYGSRGFDQVMGRESHLPDHQVTKKMKSSRDCMPIAGSLSGSHENDSDYTVSNEMVVKDTSAHDTSLEADDWVPLANGYWSSSDDDDHIDSGVADTDGSKPDSLEGNIKEGPSNVLCLSSSSSGYDSGNDAIDMVNPDPSNIVECLSFNEVDNGGRKTCIINEETGDYSKRDKDSFEHVQELLHEEDVEEQHNEAVVDALVENPYQVKSNEDTVPVQKLQQRRTSKRKNTKKGGESKNVLAESNGTSAAADATGEKYSSRVEGEDTTRLCRRDDSFEHVQELLHEADAEEQHNEAAHDALMEQPNQVKSDEDIEKEKQIKNPTSAGDMYKFLADAILRRGPRAEDVECTDKDNQVEAPPTDKQFTLPLKFRFEDESPAFVEKTETEKEHERLFQILDNFLWDVDMPEASPTPIVNPENGCSLSGETQEDRCARGEHEYTHKDDEGQVCIYCYHVGLGPRDILPEWGKSTRRRAGRKMPSSNHVEDLPSSNHVEVDDLPELEVPLKSLVKRDASFNIIDEGTVWDIKPGVRECMYKHQQEGFEFMWKNLAGTINLAELKSSQARQEGGCIISHAPGTGKTRLTIIFLETYMKMFPRCQPLIIAPAGMLLTWEEEFKKWNFPFPFYNLKAQKFSGRESTFVLRKVTGHMRTKNIVRMGKAYSWDDNVSVLGISYNLFEKLTGGGTKKNTKAGKVLEEHDHGSLRKILLEKPGLVIMDEGHYPRNGQSKIWNCFLQLETKLRVVLSGTPFQNNLTELHNTLTLVRPSVASMFEGDGIYTSKGKRNCRSKDTQTGSVPEVINSDALEKLKSVMRPFVNVHKGTILRDSLPGMKEIVVVLRPTQLQKNFIEKLKRRNSIEHEHMEVSISVHPYLLTLLKKEDIERLELDTSSVRDLKLEPEQGAKTRFIFDLLVRAIKKDEKVLIFSQFIQPLKLILDQAKHYFGWVLGREILMLDGKIKPTKRQDLINCYNDPKSEAKLMLASTRCCNEGISLVGASRVVLLDVVWNPSVETQAVSRAYRIGQKKFVYTYHLLTSGTNEGHKYCCQAEKARLSELVFCSSSEECDKMKNRSADVDDEILNEMKSNPNSKEMFAVTIDNPKEADLKHILVDG